MRKTTIITAIILAACIFSAGCQRRYDGMTIRPGVLMVGIDISYPPMEYFADDGVTPIGFNVDMAKEIAERLNLRPELINTAWEGIFDGVETNRYDVIISSVTITQARLERHNFSKPYIANALAMVLLRGSGETARTPYELEGREVGFQVATTADFYMERIAEETGMRFSPRRYDQMIRAFDELRLGRLDAVVTDFLVAYDYVAPADSPFEMVWVSDEGEVFGIVLRRNNDALTAAINQVLEDMFDDGTMLRISYDIFGMDVVTQARATW